jgi:hypothetical protein
MSSAGDSCFRSAFHNPWPLLPRTQALFVLRSGLKLWRSFSRLAVNGLNSYEIFPLAGRPSWLYIFGRFSPSTLAPLVRLHCANSNSVMAVAYSKRKGPYLYFFSTPRYLCLSPYWLLSWKNHWPMAAGAAPLAYSATWNNHDERLRLIPD